MNIFHSYNLNIFSWRHPNVLGRRVLVAWRGANRYKMDQHCQRSCWPRIGRFWSQRQGEGRAKSPDRWSIFLIHVNKKSSRRFTTIDKIDKLSTFQGDIGAVFWICVIQIIFAVLPGILACITPKRDDRRDSKSM